MRLHDVLCPASYLLAFVITLQLSAFAYSNHSETGVPVRNITEVYLTHLHSDHVTGLRECGHSLVISADTKFSRELIRIAKRTDCLIQVAWTVGGMNPVPSAQRSIATAEDAARVFLEVHPRLAVIYHYKEDTGLANAIRVIYPGSFVIARDLMTIAIGRKINWKSGRDSGTIY
jgi:ribonuclease BN (tRNA processing enzyme)